MNVLTSATDNPPPFHPLNALRSRSMGAKFVIVCVLALFMSIPGFFVDSLVDSRSSGVVNAAPTLSLPFMQTADAYRSITRSIKYISLFLGIVFLTYFIFEVTSGKRVHPAQYVLVGIAQVIFYLLLLSIAEHLGFDLAFLIAGLATVALLSLNANWVFSSARLGVRAAILFTLLYTFIFLLLRLRNNALLVGSVAAFLTVASVMYATRNLNWYGAPAQPTQP
jgi:inner membrane protein involved in colicin E2 resistance